MLPTFIPSPSRGVWYLGPVPIRAYAMFILLGIVVATWWTRRRWVAMGRDPDQVFDIVLWAVPFGIVGGRLYHLITDPELYFAPGRQPIRALYIWDGGLGIWGAVALGAVGAWIACRKLGVPLTDFAERTGLPPERIAAPLAEGHHRGWLRDDRRRLQTTALGQRFLNDVIAGFLA